MSARNHLIFDYEYDSNVEPQTEDSKSEVHLSVPQTEKTSSKEHLSVPQIERSKSKEHLSVPQVERPKSKEHLSVPQIERPKSKEHLSVPQIEIPKSKEHLSETQIEKPYSTENLLGPCTGKSKRKEHVPRSKSKEVKDEELSSHNKELSLARAFKLLMVSLDNNSKVLEHTADILQRRLPESRGHPSTLDITNSHVDHGTQNIRTKKVVVELKLTFMKITDIDTVNQQFEAEILVRAKWQEPLLKEQIHTKFDPMTMWTPKLLVLNLDGDFIVNKTTYNVVHDAPGYADPLVIWLWRFKGFFQENLELQHFPIDVQDLTISITSERSEDELDLIQDLNALSTVNTETFMDIQEWDIYEHVETYENKSTMEYVSSVTHPIFHAQCRVKRKVGYFMWNIVFIVGLITVLVFTTFSIEPYSADRLAVAITLLLTSVTFKLIVKQSLPTISYLTYLDLYVLAALVFLGLTSAQHAAVKYLSTFKSTDIVNEYDNYSLYCLAIVFGCFHFVFAIFVLLTAKRKFMNLCGSTQTERAITMSMSKYGKVHDNKI